MSALFRHLRVHQIFGANTDVGKTILTSALIRASAGKNIPVFYLKPVSTGPTNEADDEHIKRHSGSRKDLIHTECLFRYGDPVSPQLAAERAGGKVPSDDIFVKSVASYIRQCAARSTQPAHMYIETAGGVHSPTLSGTTQADSYRPLFLPTVLIGDSKLGGISTTISSYESLLLRGYSVDCVLLFKDEYYRNWEYLTSYFAEHGIRVAAVDAPPPLLSNSTLNFESTEKYYESIVSEGKEGGIHDIIDHMDSCHSRRLSDLQTMPRRTLDSIWWPFVQHGLVQNEQDVNVIDSAYSDFFSIRSKSTPTIETDNQSILEPQFDGSASWWTQALGHAHPSLTLAAARAAGRYGHVMFPQATHLPALKLAESLLDGPGKGWASRVFYSDDGATGMEIALKMALRAFTVGQGNSLDSTTRKNLGVLGLRGSYHGDTIGAMDACEDTGVYTCEWHHARGYWFDPPSVSFQLAQATITLPSAIVAEAKLSSNAIQVESLEWMYDVPTRLETPLASIYRQYIERTLRNIQNSDGPKLAALVLEPLVMGAGGMIFVDPLFQRILIDVVRGPIFSSPSLPSGLPVIFDEVFVGLYRLGMQSTGPLLGTYPDISVNAKILTGGLLPLATTMASDAIFQAFMSENKTDALLHGHSYTAHPIGCEVANESLKIIQSLTSSDLWMNARKEWTDTTMLTGAPKDVWSFWDPDFVRVLSCMDIVSDVMTLGTLLAIKMKDNSGAGYSSKSAQTLLSSIGPSPIDEPLLSAAPGGAPYGINFRTLGDVAYFMTSLNTPTATIRSVEDRIYEALSKQNSS